MSNKTVFESIFFQVFFYDVFSTKEKSMITKYFTVCKTTVELNIMLKEKHINDNIQQYSDV